ncbi:hypothetical protein FB381_2467 [Nocardioides albertanoniae]|uniref:Type VII secretion system (Wss) protein ESAT-6 n=1 Tax=Nocardioides albertanoniae TaxID=1175486 RepID=A0A543A7X6_9ACTN|nr:flagellar protein FlgN [Nocardioides albertanoniae]TQL68576.1 hypothetical protein FB381_2467 [Nocardioides albertanoniae]
MSDVEINYAALSEVKAALDVIVSELDSAPNRAADLESAVADPFGETGLRDQSTEFEVRWDDKRARLRDSLEQISEHVQAVIDAFDSLDTAAARMVDQ